MDSDVAGFLLSLAINGSIGLLALLFFFLLRNKPSLQWVYTPRTAIPDLQDPTNREIPSEVPKNLFRWAHVTWKTSDDDLVKLLGVDGVMILRFYKFSAKFFFIISFFGLVVLIPTYASGEENLTGFNKISIANLVNKSSLMTLSVLAAYAFAGLLYFFIYKEYKHYIGIRHKHFMGRITAGAATVLVTDIPKRLRYDGKLQEYFESLFGKQAILDVHIVRATGELENLAEKKEQHIHAVEKARVIMEESGKAPQHRTKLCGPKVESIPYYETEIAELRRKIRELVKAAEEKAVFIPDEVPQESQFDSLSLESCAAFVTFANFASKYQAVKFPDAEKLRCKSAPEPSDVFWKNLTLSYKHKYARKITVLCFVIALVAFYMIPITFVSSLTTLSKLQDTFPSIYSVLTKNAAIQGFVEGFLPTLAYTLFMLLLPVLLLKLSELEGRNSYSSLDAGVFEKFFYFQFINFYLASVFASSFLTTVENLDNILTTLAEAIPQYAAFFLNYIMLTAFSGVPLTLLQVVRVIIGSIKKRYLCKTPYEVSQVEMPESFDYGKEYPMQLLIFLVGFTYCVITPILSPFSAVFFFFCWFVYVYQLSFVYVPKYESGGRLFSRVLHRVLLGAIVAQLTLIGYFGVKESPIFAGIVAPLPFLTVAFYFFLLYSFSLAERSLYPEEIAEIDKILEAAHASGEDKENSGPRLIQGKELRDMYTQSCFLLDDDEQVDPEKEPLESEEKIMLNEESAADNNSQERQELLIHSTA